MITSNLNPFYCWIDDAHGRKATADRVVGEKAHLIRTAKTQEQYKKVIFDLAFFTKFTKATHQRDLTQEEVGNLVTWCVMNGYDIKPKFLTPEW